MDLLIEEEGILKAVELKAAKTFNTRLLSGLSWWQKNTGQPPEHSHLIYLGNQRFQTEYGTLVPWKEIIFGNRTR